MNKKFFGMLAATAMIAGAAVADTVMMSGTIDGSEPTFDQPLSVAEVFTSYDVFQITVDTDGTYGFYSFYPGDTSLDENMDGTLFVYDSAFDPLNPGDFIGGDDDYSAGQIALLDPFDDDATGSNASGFEVALTAGTTYFVVQSTFSDVPTSFGQPTGPYDMTITGPGGITVIPAPAVGALLLTGLAGGFGASRRRRA